jgi:hypothetical protein
MIPFARSVHLHRSPARSRLRWAGGVLLSLLVISLSAPAAASAQESMPRLTFGGKGLVSFDLNGTTPFAAGETGDTDFGTVNNFSDSFLLLRLDRQLYEKDRAGLVVGLLFPDAETELGEVFYNQVHVFYDSEHFGGKLGRTRLTNWVLEFPTLREEDLIEYGVVNNGFSNAENSEFSRYGNVVRAELFQMSSRLVLAGQASNWKETDAAGEELDQFDVNAASASLTYRLPAGVRYEGFVRRAGVELVSQNVDAPGRSWMHALVGGAALNLTRNPLRNVELRTQAIYNFGVDPEDEGLVFEPGGEAAPAPVTLADPVGRARSESLAVVTSLRLLSRPYQLDRFQAAVTGAYKEFVDGGGSQFAVVPNVFFRLGQGVDLGLQYRYEQFDDALAGALGRKRDHSVQLTMSFGFQLMFNDYFGERDDILNMEHGYIP